MTNRQRQRQYYFHPMDSDPIYDEDGNEVGTSRVDCMECTEYQKNSDIRRIIQQCQDSLERREIARQNILNNAYDRFDNNRSYRYKGKYYNHPGQLFWKNDVEYIDKHQYVGFKHTENNINRCESIIADRITNPYYVFFFYPSNVNIDTSEYERFFHSSHPEPEDAVRSIERSIRATVNGTLEAQRIYFVLYFGDNRDDGKLVWNPSIPLLEY